jgi:hypothetical protein
MKPTNTKSGGIKFSGDSYNPNANKGGLGKAKAKAAAKMTKKELSLQEPLGAKKAIGSA